MTVRVCAVGGRRLLFFEHALTRRDLDGAFAFERFERVDQQVGEQLAELMLIALNRRQALRRR